MGRHFYNFHQFREFLANICFGKIQQIVNFVASDDPKKNLEHIFIIFKGKFEIKWEFPPVDMGSVPLKRTLGRTLCEPHMIYRNPRSTVGTPYGLRSIPCPFGVLIGPLGSIKVHIMAQNMDLGLSISGSIRSILVHIGSFFAVQTSLLCIVHGIPSWHHGRPSWHHGRPSQHHGGHS